MYVEFIDEPRQLVERAWRQSTLSEFKTVSCEKQWILYFESLFNDIFYAILYNYLTLSFGSQQF